MVYVHHFAKTAEEVVFAMPVEDVDLSNDFTNPADVVLDFAITAIKYSFINSYFHKSILSN